MEMMVRSLLAGLLLVSAVSAAQYSVDRAVARVTAMVGANEETVERAEECAARAANHAMARLRPMVRNMASELGAAVECMAARGGLCDSANGWVKSMEGVWKAYGH